MAKNITAVQLGAQPKVVEANTVQDILTAFDLKGVSVKVNGQEADANTTLKEFDFVSFGEKVKGGAQA